jgi:hypothetical protein
MQLEYGAVAVCFICSFHPQIFGRRERKKENLNSYFWRWFHSGVRKQVFSRHVVYADETEVDIAGREPKGIRNSKEANTIWKILLQICMSFILHQKILGTKRLQYQAFSFLRSKILFNHTSLEMSLNDLRNNTC